MALYEATQTDDQWLAGILEGDGSFVRCPPRGAHLREYPRVQFSSVDGDVAARVALLMHASTGTPTVWGKSVQAATCVSKTGSGASTVMMRVYPWLGERRSEKVRALLRLPDNFLPRRQEDTLAWFAGLMEAEGSFYSGRKPTHLTVDVKMNDLDVIERAQAFLPSTIKKSNSEIPYYRLRLSRLLEASELMASLLPFMGNRRRSHIISLLSKAGVSHP